MLNEHPENALEMLLVQDQKPVETLRANRPHEPFGNCVRLRGAKRRANDLNPVASEHAVKTVGEFPIPVADEETEGFPVLGQDPRELSGLLCDPLTARLGRASREMHTTTAQLDQEEHVESLEPDRLDGKEIYREHAAPGALARIRATSRSRVGRPRGLWSGNTPSDPWLQPKADPSFPS